MKIKILGCSGGRSIDSDPTCFLIDDRILIDAGAATNKLEDKDLKKLEHLIITHSHFDHIADLPFLMEKLFWIKNETFTMHCSEESWDAIISNILNNSVWPNLIDIAKTKNKIFQWSRISNLSAINILNYTVTPIRVNHIVATDGLIIDDGSSSIAFTADTYKTDQFWEICNKQTNLKAIIADVSFPNKMDETAEITKHLTPKLFYEETIKLDRDDLRFYISHIKPLFKDEVVKDLAELPIQKSMEILQEGMELTIS